MGRRIQFTVLLLAGLFIMPMLATIPPTILPENPAPSPSKVSGRAAVTCSTMTISALPSTLNLSTGQCTSISLGTLASQTVLEISIQVTSSPVDLLFFNENGATTYLSGQNYHLAMTSDPTFESLSSTANYHWQIPTSISDKEWFIIVDNMAHPGDEGFGDQGLNSSMVEIDVNVLTAGVFDLFHGLEVLAPGSHTELIGGSELTFDEGDKLTFTTWPVTGDADLYLMTDAHRAEYLSGGEGETFISGASLTSITTEQTLVWTVPASLDGVPLHLMMDNEAEPSGGGMGAGMAKLSLKLKLTPVVVPEFSTQGSELGTTIGFEADMPNRHNQINTLKWDFDTSIDNDGNGIFDDDNDAAGWAVSTIYSSPGVYNVNLLVTSIDNRSASISHSLTVIDTVAPTLSLSIPGLDSQMHVLVDHNQMITASADAGDAHSIASINWIVDGGLHGSGESVSLQWGIPGEHQVEVIATDPSGNSESVMVVIEVVDTTSPVINSEGTSIPLNAQVGKSVKFNASATDAWDDASDLHYSWDLDPTFDADGDGNARNDPDLEGANPGHIFQSSGKTEIVLTVTDAAGNSDTAGFTIQVALAPDEGSLFAIVLIIAVVAIGTIIAGLIGFRKVQEHKAVELLVSRGLSMAEAETQVLSIKVSRQLSVFANAETLAGLDAGEVKTTVQIQNDEKSRLSHQLYGGSSGMTTGGVSDPNAVPSAVISDPNAGFQRQNTVQYSGGNTGGAYGGAGRVSAENELARIAGVSPNQSGSSHLQGGVEGGFAQELAPQVLSDDVFDAFAEDNLGDGDEDDAFSVVSDESTYSDHFNPIAGTQAPSPAAQQEPVAQQAPATPHHYPIQGPSKADISASISGGRTDENEDEDVAFLRKLEAQNIADKAAAAAAAATTTAQAVTTATTTTTTPLATADASNTKPQPQVRRLEIGVELPKSGLQSSTKEVTSANLVEAACGACQSHFGVTFPEGTNEVLLDCPSCGVEQTLQR